VGKIGLKGLPVEERLVRVRAAEIEDRGFLNRWRGVAGERVAAAVGVANARASSSAGGLTATGRPSG